MRHVLLINSVLLLCHGFQGEELTYESSSLLRLPSRLFWMIEHPPYGLCQRFSITWWNEASILSPPCHLRDTLYVGCDNRCFYEQ